MCNHRGASKCTSYNPKQMRKERIYIICPLTIPISTLQAIVAKAKLKKDVEVTYYERGTIYSRENLEKADSVIIILPNAVFKCPLTSLPEGSLKELRYAIDAEKPIYLGYQSLSGGPNIYEFDYFDERCIHGIAGTSTQFFRDKNVKEEIKPSFKYRFKTEQEFRNDGIIEDGSKTPRCWNSVGQMNKFIGQNIAPEYNDLIDEAIREQKYFRLHGWAFAFDNVVLISDIPDQPEMIDLRKKSVSVTREGLSKKFAIAEVEGYVVKHDTPYDFSVLDQSITPNRKRLLLLLR